MSNTRKHSRSSQKSATSAQDWKSKLGSIKADMIESMPEQEKKAYQMEQQNKVIIGKN